MKYTKFLFLILILISCNRSKIKIHDFPVTVIKDKPLIIKPINYAEFPDSLGKIYKSIQYKKEFNCDIEEPKSELGGFSPKYPMLVLTSVCLFYKCLKRDNITCYQLLIKKNGEYILISDIDELKRIFAPVESSEEAISFVCALTNSYPLYTFDTSSKIKYFKNEIFKTYVSKIGNDFIVHLYEYEFLGCEPHFMYSMIYLVYQNGDIKKLSEEKIYQDTEDHTCRD